MEFNYFLFQTEYNAEVVYSTDGQDYIDKLDDVG